MKKALIVIGWVVILIAETILIIKSPHTPTVIGVLLIELLCTLYIGIVFGLTLSLRAVLVGSIIFNLLVGTALYRFEDWSLGLMACLGLGLFFGLISILSGLTTRTIMVKHEVKTEVAR